MNLLWRAPIPGTFYRYGCGAVDGSAGDIALRYAFSTRPILKLEIAAQTIFDFLFGPVCGCCDSLRHGPAHDPGAEKAGFLISDNYKMIYSICARDRDEEERLYLRLLLVTDYICGMTDTFAKDMYQELNGIR